MVYYYRLLGILKVNFVVEICGSYVKVVPQLPKNAIAAAVILSIEIIFINTLSTLLDIYEYHKSITYYMILLETRNKHYMKASSF